MDLNSNAIKNAESKNSPEFFFISSNGLKFLAKQNIFLELAKELKTRGFTEITEKPQGQFHSFSLDI